MNHLNIRMKSGATMRRLHTLILLCSLFAFSAAAYAQGGKNYIINHFVSDPDIIESHLVVTDVEGKGPSVSMKFYDNSGTLIGQGSERVQPFGKLNLNPGRYVRNAVVNGTVHVSSDGGNIVAEYWQFYKNKSETWKNTTTIGREKPGHTHLVCPHFVSDNDVESYLVFASSDGKASEVKVVYYTDSGDKLGESTQSVNSNGKLILQPFKQLRKKTTGVAFITVTGGKVTGEYWQAQGGKDYQISNPMSGM